MIQKIELSEEYNLTKVTDLGCNVSKIFVQKYSLIKRVHGNAYIFNTKKIFQLSWVSRKMVHFPYDLFRFEFLCALKDIIRYCST